MFNSGSRIKSKAVKGVLGMSAAATLSLAVLIEPWEQRVLKPYWDPYGKVWTYCAGLTSSSKPNVDKFTETQCIAMEAVSVARHEAALDRCLRVQVPLETKAALISFTYNVGSGAVCRSTLMRKANTGDLVGACNELPKWVFAGGVKLRGLENRRYKGDTHRMSERSLCLMGLDKNYEPPLMEKMLVKFKTWRTSIVQKTGDA